MLYAMHSRKMTLISRPFRMNHALLIYTPIVYHMLMLSYTHFFPLPNHPTLYSEGNRLVYTNITYQPISGDAAYFVVYLPKYHLHIYVLHRNYSPPFAYHKKSSEVALNLNDLPSGLPSTTYGRLDYSNILYNF